MGISIFVGSVCALPIIYLICVVVCYAISRWWWERPSNDLDAGLRGVFVWFWPFFLYRYVSELWENRE